MIARIAAVLLFCTGLFCLSQAQVPMTGAGLGAPATGGGGGNVTIDTVGTKTVSAGGVSSANYTGATVGSGANRALLITVALSNPAVTSVTVHWDSAGTNQSMTNLCNIAGSTWGYTSIFSLLAPTTGAGLNVLVSWAGALAQLKIDSISFTNVNQSGGASSFTTNTNSGTSAADTITQTSATGNYVMALHQVDSNAPNINSVDQTTLYTDSTGSVASGANYATGSASVVLTATYSSSFHWTAASVNIIHQ